MPAPITTYLTEQQRAMLMQPVDPQRVNQLRGNSYLSQHDIRRWLIRIFGFARFSVDTTAMELCYEQPNQDHSRVSVGYRAQVKLTVCSVDGTKLATYTEWAAGQSINQPINMRGDAHDNAMKNAESYAMKRCAINLGDQFGLGLYDHGNLAAFVGGTLLDGAQPDGITADDGQVAPDETDAQETVQEPVQTPIQERASSPVNQAKLERWDSIDALNVDIASESPDVRNRLRVLWQVNGLPPIDKLDMPGVGKVRELLEEAKNAELIDNQVPDDDGPPAVLDDRQGDPAARRGFYGTMDQARQEPRTDSPYYE